MLLSALREFAFRNRDAESRPDFYSMQEVRYRIDLDGEGRLLSFDACADPDRPKHGVKLAIPYLKRTRAVIPLPLDRGDYVLGVPATKKDPRDQAKADARAPELHQAWLDLIGRAASETGLPTLAAMHRFGADYDRDDATVRPQNYDASAFVAVYVEGVLVTREPVFQRWWAESQRAGEGVIGDVEDSSRVCSVCGARAQPLKNVTTAIRGMGGIGGQAIMALVSGNEDVFERHGMPRAAGASLCIDCGEASHQALNQLLADPTHAKRFGQAIFVWWATVDADDWMDALFNGHTEESVRALLGSIATSRKSVAVDPDRFYAVTLGANASRVVVRSWVDTTLRDAQQHILRWSGRIAVVGWDGRAADRPGIFRMLASIAPPGQGDPLSRLEPGLPDAVLQAALAGRALPPAVLAQVVGRLRADQGKVTALRAALLKACLTPPDHPTPEDHMTGLDTDSTDPAYLCGRLLALLDDAARLATTARNSLVSRSYASASTMPGITLTRLLRLHQAHLEKLVRDKPGAAWRIQSAVTEILDHFPAADLPRTLSVTQQGRFALGLYHQQAAGHRAASEAKASRVLEAAASSDPNAPDTSENEEQNR